MLTIRKTQLNALKSQLEIKLHGDLLKHVRKHFADDMNGKTDSALLREIRHALKRADIYELKTEQDLYKYINIAVLYGFDFDTQLETAWTLDYLVDKEVRNPTQRINRLYEEVVYRLEVEENNKRIQDQFYPKPQG